MLWVLRRYCAFHTCFCRPNPGKASGMHFYRDLFGVGKVAGLRREWPAGRALPVRGSAGPR